MKDLQRQPHLLMKLAGNSLTVAESLRENYFKNTAKFVAHVRTAMRTAAVGKRSDSIVETVKVDDTDWSKRQGEVVTFMDGDIGEVPALDVDEAILSEQLINFPVLAKIKEPESQGEREEKDAFEASEEASMSGRITP